MKDISKLKICEELFRDYIQCIVKQTDPIHCIHLAEKLKQTCQLKEEWFPSTLEKTKT